MKAAIYCRVSTEGQEQDGTSLQTQLEACQDYCKLKGYEVAYEFGEAWSGLSLERLKLTELREVVRSESIDAVVVYIGLPADVALLTLLMRRIRHFTSPSDRAVARVTTI